MSEGAGEVQPIIPELLVKGQFGIFETPDGGIHLTVKMEGSEDVKHMEFSPMMLRAMKMAFPGKGDPIAMLKGGLSG